MGWEVFVPIIVQYGLPVAEKLWILWSTKAEPTANDWAELRTLASQSAKDRMLLQLVARGIDPTSDQGKALLALVGV